MAELPDLIKDLALILIVAGTVTLIFKRLKQPLVLGYLVAGFLVSPHMPYTMHVLDEANIQIWADIGVMFLLFSLGLDFSFKKIIKMGLSPVIATLTIIFFMMMLGMGIGEVFHWSRMDCIFLGGMLAMSSTTIIYKAFDELGLRQQHFAGLVMSVLILEDILAIVMMVMLSAIAQGNNPDGGQMVGAILRIGFFLILWFIIGLLVIPTFLRNTRKLMTDETMVIVSLGLCCLMAWISTSVGFSPAFGAFIMGSILAETVEADKIIKLVEPVKNLFGAIFFVSVGMLVNPSVLASYAIPIIVLSLTILLGQSIFGTFGYMLSGHSLKTAMRSGFSMAQIGEFAFIIASLGLSLGVISNFLYPVVVAVSVITTFLTPYMIRAAVPCYDGIERILPRRWVRWLNHLGTAHITTSKEDSNWKRLIKKITVSTVIYSILCTAITTLMLTFFLPLCRSMFSRWWANTVCGLVTLIIIAPFMRALIMKHMHSDEFRTLWTESLLNRAPLVFTVLVRIVIVGAFLFYICNKLSHFRDAMIVTLSAILIIVMILSRRLKKRSIRLERLFIKNLQSRDIEAQVKGRRRPLYEGRLLDRDIHISDFEVPQDSKWAGKRLYQLKLRNRFGVHVSSILRGMQRINIPNGETIVFPKDRLQVIGSDEQLHLFGQALKGELIPEDYHIEDREMKLKKIILTNHCAFIGKTLKESHIRDQYNCMLVGLEEGQQNLTMINPSHQFRKGDVIWVVGERTAIQALEAIA